MIKLMVKSNRSWDLRSSNKPIPSNSLIFFILLTLFAIKEIDSNTDAKRLYDDLLFGYNKLVRPVSNSTNPVSVYIKLKLSRLVEVNLKDQIMVTNMWVEQHWHDNNLRWDPSEYGGVDTLHVPSDHIWKPDLALYNNAAGNFDLPLNTKALVTCDGLIRWKSPSIYRSSCDIDAEYFPFDIQTCIMKFGCWTFDGSQIDLRHIDQEEDKSDIKDGIDLSEFYLNVEWDIIEAPARRNVRYYICCNQPYIDITFNISMRRKSLFYTVNMIIPCMGISFLTVLVFFLPSDSGEKISLSVSVLLALIVFFLLLAETIPATSNTVPLLGKYLLFTMILVTLSISSTVIVLNIHFRSSSTHHMSPWIAELFMHILPKILFIKRPLYADSSINSKVFNKCPSQPEFSNKQVVKEHSQNSCQFKSSLIVPNIPSSPRASRRSQNDNRYHHSSLASTNILQHQNEQRQTNSNVPIQNPIVSPITGHLSECQQARLLDQTETSPRLCPDLLDALKNVQFLANHKKKSLEYQQIKENWKFVAMVLDRLFLWLFSFAVATGAMLIFAQAWLIYDIQKSIDTKLTKVD